MTMTPAAPSDELTHLLDTARGWLAGGSRVALATVIETWGSAPRRRGAHALIRDDGLFEGSVSGGCVEGDVLLTAQELFADPAGGSRRLDYGVADDRAWEVGLACGGRISVLLQTIDADHFPPALLDRIAVARGEGRPVRVATTLATGRSREAASPEAGEDFLATYAPALRMLIVGAVHVAQALAPLARMMGYHPLVVDPRQSFAAAARFPELDVDMRWPDEAFAEWRPDAATAVVTLTHDPKIDDPALEAALASPAFYIAALGSRRTQAMRLERLAARGFDAGALARINGPAGLPIGAASPAEIALSIMAQAVEAHRRAS